MYTNVCAEMPHSDDIPRRVTFDDEFSCPFLGEWKGRWVALQKTLNLPVFQI